jgi:hypothetical protein
MARLTRREWIIRIIVLIIVGSFITGALTSIFYSGF